MIRDGLAVRDGLHMIKIHGFVPLQPYLIDAIERCDVDESGSRTSWTPRMFLDEADALFRRRFPEWVDAGK